jgi:hypothetical protein
MLNQSGTGRVALAVIATAAAGLLLAGCGASKRTSQANRRWANTVCTDMLTWQKQVHHDLISLNLALGPRARLNDTIETTRRLVNEITVLGPPASQRESRDQATFRQLGSAVQTKLTEAQTAANKLENGNVDGATALISDLRDGASLAAALISNARHLATTDLAIAVLDTKTCRQVAGLPV